MNYLLTWTAIPTATSYDINSRYMDGSFVLLGTASTNSLTVSVSSFTAFQILAKDISANVINIQYAYYPTFQYFINGQDVVDLVRSEVDDGDLQGGYTFSNELMQNFIDQAAIKYARYIPNMVTVAELTQTAILDSSTIEVFDVYTPDSKGMKTNNYEEWSFDYVTKSFTNYEVQDGTAYNIVTKIPYTKIVDNYQIPKPDAIYFIKDLVIVTCLEAIMNNLVQRPDTTEGQTQILWSLSQKELAKRIGKLRGRIHSQLSDVSIGVY